MARAVMVALAIVVAIGVPATARAQGAAPSVPRIHVEADAPDVTLYEQTFGGAARPLCKPPCDRVLDTRPGRAFFFTGDDIPPSRPFFVTDTTRDFTVVVDAGSRSAKLAGVLATVAGSVGLLGGAFLLAWSARDGGPDGKAIAFEAFTGAMSATLLVGGIISLTKIRTKFRMVGIAPAPGGLGFRF